MTFRRENDMQTFINARVILKDSILENGYAQEHDGTIISYGDMENCCTEKGEVVDCKGQYLSPGFVDIHVHGGGGHDFMDGTLEAVLGAAKAHLKHGTTTLLPTTLTSSDETLYETIDLFKQAQKMTENMPHMPGLHLEGPYFADSQKGAQDPRYILDPTPEHYRKIMEISQGGILRWSVAPEREGALEMAKELSAQGVTMAVGHTNATYDDMKNAVEAGYNLVTHWYSGMSTIERKGGFRVLGVIESTYLLDELHAEIIADGMHLPPELLQMIVKCKDNDSICLVTDAMRGADMPDGESILGSLADGQRVFIEDGIAKMPDRKSFAGSVATTDRLVRVMVQKANLSVQQAVKMMTYNPAKFVNLHDSVGSIDVGKNADLLIFDDDIQVQAVYVSGKKTAI